MYTDLEIIIIVACIILLAICYVGMTAGDKISRTTDRSKRYVQPPRDKEK